MALTDPQSVTIAGAANSLPLVSRANYSGVYQSADGNVKLTVSHQNGKRFRRLARLDHRKIATDPLLEQSVQYGMSAQLIIDVPQVGYTVAQAKEVVDGFIAALNASSGALITKILGAES